MWPSCKTSVEGSLRFAQENCLKSGSSCVVLALSSTMAQCNRCVTADITSVQFVQFLSFTKACLLDRELEGHRHLIFGWCLTLRTNAAFFNDHCSEIFVRWYIVNNLLLSLCLGFSYHALMSQMSLARMQGSQCLHCLSGLPTVPTFLMSVCFMHCEHSIVASFCVHFKFRGFQSFGSARECRTLSDNKPLMYFVLLKLDESKACYELKVRGKLLCFLMWCL